MTDLPEELRQLIASEEPLDEDLPSTPDEQLIQDMAHLLFPLSHPDSPREAEDRENFVRRYRRRLTRNAFTGGDDVLLDQLRALRHHQAETQRRIDVLLAYARTTPPRGRKYRLRDLSEASGLPISSIRDRITEEELRSVAALDLDGERAEQLARKLAASRKK